MVLLFYIRTAKDDTIDERPEHETGANASI